MHTTRRTNWEFTDDEGIKWHEFPHSKDSHARVSWSVSEAQLDDGDAPAYEYHLVDLNRDDTISVSENFPIDTLSTLITRAKKWLGGMPKDGTRMVPRRKAQ